MTYHLRARWSIPGTSYELQQIDGSDGSVWIRISNEAALLAVYSAVRLGPGVMPKDRIIKVLAEAATAHNPSVIINALRFHGWEFWPGGPAPLVDYLRHDFLRELAQVDSVNVVG